MATATNERRVSLRCPCCKGTQINQETTVKNITTTKWWKCVACGKTWPEKRKPAA